MTDIAEMLDSLDAVLATPVPRGRRKRAIVFHVYGTPVLLGQHGVPLAVEADGRRPYGFTLRQVKAMRALLGQALREHAGLGP